MESRGHSQDKTYRKLCSTALLNSELGTITTSLGRLMLAGEEVEQSSRTNSRHQTLLLVSSNIRTVLGSVFCTTQNGRGLLTELEEPFYIL